MMRMLSRILSLVSATMVATGAIAAPDDTKPLFASDTPIPLTIRGTLPKAPTVDQATEGVLTVAGSAGESLPIKMTVRGITRRKSEICKFPPLRIEFTQKPGAGSPFAGQHRLKLVTHCQGTSVYRQYLLIEYAAYRMYRLLTPVSFGVRLAAIDYIDGSGKTITSKPGFLIEDTDDVAKRNALHEAKTGDRVPVAMLDPAGAAREAVFQYMIGNLDWAMNGGPVGSGCCHNTKLLAAPGAVTGLVPVPYDYDFSGLVDAPYASPPDKVDVANVRVRRYRGFCRHNAEALVAAADIRSKQAALLAVFDGIPGLDDGTRRKALHYLGSFFDQIGSDQIVTENLLKTCIG